MENNKETWKPVPGYEDYYEVSSTGRVRRLFESPQRKRELSPWHGRGGYPQVELWKDNKRKSIYVHTLVTMTFIGERPSGFQVCHYDGNPENNNIENLRYDTVSENRHDSVRHGTHAMANRTRCPYGHLLKHPNLQPSALKRGSRKCLACTRARSYIYYHKHLKSKFQEISDSYYRNISGGGQA